MTTGKAWRSQPVCAGSLLPASVPETRYISQQQGIVQASLHLQNAAQPTRKDQTLTNTPRMWCLGPSGKMQRRPPKNDNRLFCVGPLSLLCHCSSARLTCQNPCSCQQSSLGSLLRPDCVHHQTSDTLSEPVCHAKIARQSVVAGRCNSSALGTRGSHQQQELSHQSSVMTTQPCMPSGCHCLSLLCRCCLHIGTGRDDHVQAIRCVDCGTLPAGSSLSVSAYACSRVQGFDRWEIATASD